MMRFVDGTLRFATKFSKPNSLLAEAGLQLTYMLAEVAIKLMAQEAVS
jgi:hypothetical protein